MRAIAGRRAHWLGCGWFWAWALVGVAIALGMLSLGLLLLVPSAVAILLMARRHPINAFGLLSGIGVMLLVVAYLQRQGPGTTCWHTATASGCDQHSDPIPWLVAGLLFFVAGIIGQARRSH
jgi:hypothetical protein